MNRSLRTNSENVGGRLFLFLYSNVNWPTSWQLKKIRKDTRPPQLSSESLHTKLTKLISANCQNVTSGLKIKSKCHEKMCSHEKQERKRFSKIKNYPYYKRISQDKFETLRNESRGIRWKWRAVKMIYTTNHGMWSLPNVIVVGMRSKEANMCTNCSFADSNKGVITKKREAKVEKHENEELKIERQEKKKVKGMKKHFLQKESK